MKLSVCLMLICLMVVSVAVAPAQKADPNKLTMAFYKPIKTTATYANSQIDTSGVLALGGASRVSLVTSANDSVSYITKIDYRPSASGSWTLTVSDTVAVTAGGPATVHSWVLRDNTVEKVPGVAGQWRIRQAFAGSDNGVTTPTYSQVLWFKP